MERGIALRRESSEKGVADRGVSQNRELIEGGTDGWNHSEEGAQ